MILPSYRHHGGLWDFDTASGAVKPAGEGAAREARGCVWKQGGGWYALREDAESRIFQHGAQIWRLQPENEFQVRPGLFRRLFTISRQGRVAFSLRYRLRLSALFLVIADPTYDAMDEETDDFFAYVANLSRAKA